MRRIHVGAEQDLAEPGAQRALPGVPPAASACLHPRTEPAATLLGVAVEKPEELNPELEKAHIHHVRVPII